MPHVTKFVSLFAVLSLACGSDGADPKPVEEPTDDAGVDGEVDAGEAQTDLVPGVTEASEVDLEEARENAQPRVFLQPYQSCVAPLAGEPAGESADGQVCTNVSIAGATEPGRSFAAYADCNVVRTQRPFWEAAPFGESSDTDPRLEDEAFLTELTWVTEQVRATGCVCCHDASAYEGKFAQWDISHAPIWTDTVSDDGVALFTGLANSAVLGAYPPADNNGFDREQVGLPSTDPARMKAFFLAELARRGISEDDARAVPPFGGPIYQNQIKQPEACEGGAGVAADGTVTWGGGAARYVYVLAEGSKNPGVPPNFDKPEGTLWRLDVLPSASAVKSGVKYGKTPAGTYQVLPEAEAAPALEAGKTYHLFAELDMGFVIENCLFTYPAN